MNAREILERFLAAMDRGELPEFEALLRDHPQHADELRRLFQEECERLEATSSLSMPAGSRPASDTGRRFSAEVLARLAGRDARFERYAIRDEVGKGGMGSVLRVWDEDLRRELAMKVMQGQAAGLAGSPEASKLARFLEEAQVTSQLDHPGIVPVHELGLDPSGRVYFTMKLVQGRTFAQVLDLVRDRAEGWTEARALGVIQRVLEAMAYAHEKGVLHRDLKPANVMVGAFGEVYVMDWGLARAVGAADRRDIRLRPAATDPGAGGADPCSSLLTMDGQVVGTPAYMPPEQAAGRVEEVGPHSDVYAVGAMLYHLLAGRPPYSRVEGARDAVGVWRRVQAGSPAPLPVSAPGELAAICEKAMARDWRRRYRDTREMAGDVAAYLDGRVVRAHETGALAEARKWVKRNRGLAASLAAGLVVLVAGLVTSLALRARADANAARAQTIAGFLEQTLAGVKPSVALGRDTTMLREMMDAARARIEAGELAIDPEAELRLSHLIGSTYGEIARYDLGEPLLRRADAQARILLEADDPLRAAIASDLALLLDACGSGEEAEALAREALEARRRRHPGDHLDTASSLQNLAAVQRRRGALDEAERLLREALAMQERLLPGDSEALAMSLNNLGVVLEERGDTREAESCAARALAISRERYPGGHPLVASNANLLATLRASRGDLAGAEELHRENLELWRRLHPGDHPDTAASLNNLAFALYQQRDFAAAEQHFRLALEMQRRLLPGDHGDLAASLDNLAAARLGQGDAAGAEALQVEALEMRRRLSPDGHPDVALGLHNLAAGLRHRGEFERAEAFAREALEMARGFFPPDHPHLALFASNLGRILASRDDLEGAERALREALAVLEGRPAGLDARSSERLAACEHDLGRVLLRQARFAEAELLLLGRSSTPDEPGHLERVDLLIELYGAWERAEPAGGHGQAARAWQDEREELAGARESQPD